ncbi:MULTISPECIES: hypothetical protein [unclassified Streptomyces]
MPSRAGMRLRLPWRDHGLRGLADICSALMQAIADGATGQTAPQAGQGP